MDHKSYPRLNYLRDIANLPDDMNRKSDRWDSSRISKLIYKYYNNKPDSGVHPLSYQFTKNGQKETINTTTGIYSELQFPPIRRIKKQNRFFSEYDKNTLDKIKINTDNRWNGKVASVQYNKGNVNIGETDYYSTLPFEKMLSAEISTCDLDDNFDTPLRDRYLSNIDHFENPKRPIPATAGGIIIAEKEGEPMLIVGKRSQNTETNKGKLSIFPNGKVEFEDINGGFQSAIEREFKEELFNSKSKGKMFYDKHLDLTRVIVGWNLKSGGFTLGYILTMSSEIAYNVMDNISEYNEEIDEIIEIPINDYNQITEKVNLDKMSGSAIPVICEALLKIDNSKEYPNLEYNIKRS